MQADKTLAIIGAGPAGLFLLKQVLDTAQGPVTIFIFEAKSRAGEGMPYGHDGAGREHITNVSGNEIPKLPITLVDWVKLQSEDYLQGFGIEKKSFTAYMVVPRLLFGDYLSAQFSRLLEQGTNAGHTISLHRNTPVTDIVDQPAGKKIMICSGDQTWQVDHTVICTGHQWPKEHEGETPGYYDSPYPAAKLRGLRQHTVAIRGSSLTAIDAVRTLAREHGEFVKEGKHRLSYHLHERARGFKMILHSRNGLLPAVRFHLEDPRLSATGLATREELEQHRAQNDGFISLDFLFERNFKQPLQQKEPAFYETIKDLNLEAFVDKMMSLRDPEHPFEFFKKEYAEALVSIRRRDSIYWKEMLAILSFALNQPAKYLSAEDMQRMRKTLMPLISIVIAFVPQSSCEELMALYDAGVLDIIAVGDESKVEPHPEGGIAYHIVYENGESETVHYQTFIDAVGQRHLQWEDFPFPSLIRSGSVSVAKLRFRSAEEGAKQYREQTGPIRSEDGHYYMLVPGLAITDDFNVLAEDDSPNPRLYIMAVPYIGGFNPDYSGLDFCEEAATRVAAHIFKEK